MKTTLIFALLLMCLSLTQASDSGHRYPDQRIIQATCIMGRGCTFQLSPVTRFEIDFVNGTDEEGYYSNLPEQAIMVSAKTTRGETNYIETRRTRGQLDQLYGGDGYTMIYLFDPHIQPLDGEWVGEIGQITTSACFVDIAPYVSGFSGTKDGGMINFPKPFQTRFLMDNPNVKWVKLSADKYRGLLNFGQSSGPMTMTYDVEIVNEKLITGMGKGTIRIPTMEPCHIQIPVTFRCIKPNPPNEMEDDDWDVPIENPEDDLLPVNPKGKDDELLDINPRKNGEPATKPKTDVPRLPDDDHNDLLPVTPKSVENELLDVKPGQRSKPSGNNNQ